MTKLTAADGHAETPLHAAAWEGDLAEVSRILDAGFDVNRLDSIGESALFGAVAWARAEVAALLLERGALVTLQNNHGWSPLHWAASHGGPAMIELLIANGADPHLADSGGFKPIDIARRYGKGAHVAKLKTFMAGASGGAPKRGRAHE